MSTTETPQPIIPALRKVYAPLAPFAYTFIRVCVGLTIARHGYPKLFEGGVTGLAGFMHKSSVWNQALHGRIWSGSLNLLAA